MDPTINAKEYHSVMTGQGFSRGDLKYKDLPKADKYRIRFCLPPPPSAAYLEVVNLKIKVDDYEWNVHSQFITSMSPELKFRITGDDNVSPENHIEDA
jgi:hypothetical protein